MGLVYLKYLIFMLCFLKKTNSALLGTEFQRREGDGKVKGELGRVMGKRPAEAGIGYQWEWHVSKPPLELP